MRRTIRVGNLLRTIVSWWSRRCWCDATATGTRPGWGVCHWRRSTHAIRVIVAIAMSWRSRINCASSPSRGRTRCRSLAIQNIQMIFVARLNEKLTTIVGATLRSRRTGTPVRWWWRHRGNSFFIRSRTTWIPWSTRAVRFAWWRCSNALQTEHLCLEQAVQSQSHRVNLQKGEENSLLMHWAKHLISKII